MKPDLLTPRSPPQAGEGANLTPPSPPTPLPPAGEGSSENQRAPLLAPSPACGRGLGRGQEPLALTLLAEAVAKHPKGKAGVAEKLGCSRTLLARILSINEGLPLSAKLARRIIDVYHRVPRCPATGSEQPRSECQRLAQTAPPMHNPLAMQLWKVCQTCPHKPVK